MRLSRYAETIAERFGVTTDLQLPYGLDIRPTNPVAIVRHSRSRDERSIDVHRWGLIPSWWKQEKPPAHMFNARAESAAEKPSFRSAFKRRRCLVPVDGFYEWKKHEDGTKTKHLITHLDDQPLVLAGLWETWDSPGGETIPSFTVLTCEPNDRLSDIHDRMPVILDASRHETWLDPDNEDRAELQSMVGPCPSSWLNVQPAPA